MLRARVASLQRTALGLGLALVWVGCKHQPSPSPSSTTVARSDAGTQAAFPVQVQDDLGRAVIVRAVPKRILCLLPSFTETLFALGAGDRVVGVDDFSDYPKDAQRLPKLGGIYDTQVEHALSLKPDLIFVSEGSAAVRPLSESGIPVWAGSARKLEDVYRVIEATGKLIGRPLEAARLVSQMRDEIAAVEAGVRGLPPVSVYYELDPTPYTVGPASFIGVMISKAGGLNIVPPTLGDFPKISPELVVSSNPSVIIGASLDDVLRRPGWSGISAVKSRRVYKWSADEAHLLSRPGPRLPEGLRALARRLRTEP